MTATIPSLHDLPHRMDAQARSAIPGHVSSATMLNTYSHITDEMRQKAAVKIDQGIGKARPKSYEKAAPKEHTLASSTVSVSAGQNSPVPYPAK